MLLLQLPLELHFAIAEKLSYPDVISLGMTCKELSYFLEGTYWEKELEKSNYVRRCDKRETDIFLTPQGQYVKYATLNGIITYGSENFISIFKCIKKSYHSKDDPLLLYFLRVLDEKKWIYPIRDKINNPIKKIKEDLLRLTILDEREDTFLFVWKSIFPDDFSTLNGYTDRDLVIFRDCYLVANMKGLTRIRKALVPIAYQLIISPKREMINYAVQSRDKNIIEDMLPYLCSRNKEYLITLATAFSWSEVIALLPGVKPGSHNNEDISFSSNMSSYMYLYRNFRDRILVSKSDFTRLLEGGDREKIRKELIKGIDRNKAKDVIRFFNTSSYTIYDLYTNMFTFTVSAFVKKEIRIDTTTIPFIDFYDNNSCEETSLLDFLVQ